MSKPKYTKGPWRLAPDLATIHCGSEFDPKIVATVDINDPMVILCCDTQEANARLIAAAPEMFEKLSRGRETLRQLASLSNVNPETRRLLVTIGDSFNETIAKATGEKP